MFETHARNIKAFAALSPENMYYVLCFAVATANCPFQQSVNTLQQLKKWGENVEFIEYADITQEQKSFMGCGLTTNKLAYYQSLWAGRHNIYDKYMECLETPQGYLIFWRYVMDCLSGMGLVKAAFAVQMLFNELGCIDVHNARELGQAVPKNKLSEKHRTVYLNMQAIKTSEQWWNDWCIMLAEKYPGQFKSGEHVSELHEFAIIGGGK
jgi:thermostable 8-oxoguanine DNA glycosylase